ncbi:hypothetical protein D3C78_824130 [compost metagenome]
MTHNLEDTGPLTPEQHEEMLRHALHGTDYHDLEEDIKYYGNIVNNSNESDPAYRKFKPQLEATQRYLDLKRRFDTCGVSTIVSLDKVHDTRR